MEYLWEDDVHIFSFTLLPQPQKTVKVSSHIQFLLILCVLPSMLLLYIVCYYLYVFPLKSIKIVIAEISPVNHLSQKALHNSKALQDQIWGLVRQQKCNTPNLLLVVVFLMGVHFDFLSFTRSLST